MRLNLPVDLDGKTVLLVGAGGGADLLGTLPLSPRPPFLSPLMSVFWFFDVAGVARRSLLAGPFAATETYADVRAAYDRVRQSLEANLRPNKDIPL